MMTFWDEHEAARDRFAVLAIHNADRRAATFEQLDEQLESRGTLERWGRNLPFTVILDNSGTTTRTYGISAYPTVVLVDPEGNVYNTGGDPVLDILREKLAEE
jgi:hypothetical protein